MSDSSFHKPQTHNLNMSASTSTSKVIGTFKPCDGDDKPCTLRESLFAYETPLDHPSRSLPIMLTSIITEFYGSRVMSFPALFTPAGSGDSFPAQLYLQSTVSGTLPQMCPSLDVPHVFADGADSNLARIFTDASDSQDNLDPPSKWLDKTELDVHDRRVDLHGKSSDGQPIIGLAIEGGETQTTGDTWKLNPRGEECDPTDGRSLLGIEYRGSLWLSVPGYHPETGAVRRQVTAADTASDAGEDDESDQNDREPGWAIVQSQGNLAVQ